MRMAYVYRHSNTHAHAHSHAHTHACTRTRMHTHIHTVPQFNLQLKVCVEHWGESGSVCPCFLRLDTFKHMFWYQANDSERITAF